MNNHLRELFLNHEGKITDRWALYLNEWDRILSPYQDSDINLLEIGVHNGGSLEIWSQYFTNAKNIIGCDNDEVCQELEYDDPRIKIVIGDINSQAAKTRIKEISPQLDIIIDDGSHHSEDIIKAFAYYFQKLNAGGLYLIEDLHASYWAEAGGGLFNPLSAMAFLKRLVDLINFEHWQSDQSREKFLKPYEEHFGVRFDEFDFYQLHSIEFINSLCIIHKRPASENSLGQRVIVGSQELKPESAKKLEGTTIHDLAKAKVDDSNLDVFSLMAQAQDQERTITANEENVQRLENDIQVHTQTINQLRSEIDAQEESLQSLRAELANREKAYQGLHKEITEQRQVSQESGTLIADQSRAILKLYDEIKDQDLSLQSMETQLADEGQKLQASEHKLAIVKQDVSKLEYEILFYALSKSWRFTRPFRKMMGILRGKRHA